MEAPSNGEYLALSYVRGPQTKSPPNMAKSHQSYKTITADVPQVIRDAVTVTLGLSYRYLWVDKFCIPQISGDLGKHEQIRNTDVIYGDAVLTIVSASGTSASDSLPGVSKPRIPQPRAVVEKDIFMPSMPDSTCLIRNSKWVTRGWTYQEALLSKRHLVFTDHQMYFQCYVMHSCESLDIPLTLLHHLVPQRFATWNKLGAFPPDGIGRFGTASQNTLIANSPMSQISGMECSASFTPSNRDTSSSVIFGEYRNRQSSHYFTTDCSGNLGPR